MDAFLAIASKRDARRYDQATISAQATQRILDAGRLAGSARNKQPWTFVVVESPGPLEALAELVYAPGNIRTAALVVAVATPEGRAALDVGRCVQNMMLAAWNEGIVSTLNGMPDARGAADALGLPDTLLPLTVVSFAHPARVPDVGGRSAEDWSERADRRSLDDIVVRV